MSLTDDFLKGLAANNSSPQRASGGNSLTSDFLSGLQKSNGGDIAPIRSASPVRSVIDIAPVSSNVSGRMTTGKKKKKEEERKLDFFDKGLFEDGYNFGDITKTILGTAGDTALEAAKGVGSLVEGLTDAGGYLVAGAADLLGADDFAGKTRKGAQKNVVEDLAKGADDYLDKYSVLGKTSEAILQGVGQVGGIIATGGLGAAAGLSGAGVSALTTGVMGLSGFGSGTTQAYQEGATDEEAAMYGLISGASDAITEMIFGGLGKAINAVGFSKGLSSADDMLAKAISKKFSNQIAKNFAEFGIKAGAEGTEEVLAGIAQAAGKKATYMSEKDFKDILEDENLLEQFIVGSVTSGMIQSGIIPGTKDGSLIEANKKGSDFVTGLSQNEQAVVNKEVENRIAEREADGTKLTKKQKSDIEAQVISDMEKGYISTDTIEEVLGGESYSALKKLYEEAWEYDNLYTTPSEKLSQKQRDRLTELMKKNEANPDKAYPYRTALESARDKLAEGVFGLVQNDRLSESYNERSRRGQAYEADLSQYDAKQQEVIKKAVESGVLNNTRRTHEFVDMVAKISADKGVLFDFTNNEKLKGTQFAVDGKTVNGFVTKDGVTLNVNSSKALDTVTGHEITHVLEGTELYTELQNAIFDYAKSKGEYDGRRTSLEALYKDIKDADIDAELTADLVGDYLFSDADFINRLSTEHRNVFQKIYDEIKYLCKVATAGSKEARELEKVKRAFDKAYKAGGKAQSDTKYSISDSTGKELTKEQQDYFKDSKVRNENGNLKVMYHGSQDAGFHTFDARFSDDGTSFFFVDRNEAAATYSGTTETYAPVGFRTVEDANKFFAANGLSEYEVVKEYGEYALYDNGDVVATSESLDTLYEEFKDWSGLGYGDANYKVYLNLTNPLEVDAEGRNWNKLPSKHSKEIYDKYKSLTVEEKTALIELAEWEDWSLFKDEIEMAREVVHSGAPDAITSAVGKLMDEQGNINISNLFSVAMENFSEEAITENSFEFLTTRDYAQRAKEQGYDGVIFKNIVDLGGYSNGSEGAATVAVAFDSKQIKSVANEKPTDDADIRYSLSADSEGREISPAVQKRFGNSKVVDENGDIHRSLSAEGEQPSKYGNVHGKDIALRDTLLDIAPVATDTATVAENTTVAPDTSIQELFPDDIAPLEERKQAYNERVDAFRAKVDAADLENLPQQELDALFAEKDWLDAEAKAIQAEIDTDRERLESLDDADAPQEIDAPLPEERADLVPLTKKAVADIAKSVRSELALNNRQVSEVKSIIQKYAETEFPSRDELYSEIEDSFGTIQDKETIEDIKEVKDFLRSYKINVSPDIQSDIADYSKLMRSNFGKIRFFKDGMAVDAAYQELSSMYPGSFPDDIINPTDQLLQIIDVANGSHTAERLYEVDSETLDKVTDLIINGVNEYKQNQKLKDAEKDAKAAFDALVANADEYAPVVKENPTTQDIAPVKPVKRKSVKEEVAAAKEAPKDGKVAEIVRNANTLPREERSKGLMAATKFVDKGQAVEELSYETGNHELQPKYEAARASKAKASADWLIKYGSKKDGVKSLDEIFNQAGENEATFDEYLYHIHNIDRMTLDERFGLENMAVYGDTVTADVSRAKVKQLEAAHPEFKSYAEDVYKFNRHLRQMLVDGGLMSQKTADWLEKKYPHYVPIHRVDKSGNAISVPLDSRKTGVNNPIKRATGGNSSFQGARATMAERAVQTYRAVARNSFGIELKNTLGSTITRSKATVEEISDSIDTHEDLLKKGVNGMNPTFTVFENGERVEFEITEDLFDALKPDDPFWGQTIKPLNAVSNIRRNTLTSWNPVFALFRNPAKDMQEVFLNSQHAMKTYANVFPAIKELAHRDGNYGEYATEFFENGGRQLDYFNQDTKEFDDHKNIIKTLSGIGAIERAGDFIETVPRLAEYMASRKQGRSVEQSMLDAARVTTNFGAGGEVTKFANRHGFNFLNASVQGTAQHVRNFREAKEQGFKETVKLIAKYALTGVPGLLLNDLLWGDDEEYEELNDYVKDRYYIVGKTEDGKFIRLPKGRTAAVVEECMEQMRNKVTGNDEADFSEFFKLFMDNIAPSNPLDNNILAPILQTLNNKTWYGEDLVPSRLADLPAEEQFDESTDAISKWLGEKTGISPVKLNYLIDQYSGGFGDTFLPMLTPEAESGDDSFIGNVIAPWKKEMSTDSVLNNRYPGEFYDLRDELEVNANARGATEEDRLKSLYLDEVGWEMSDLYAEKREIQNSDLSDSEKYEAIREVQSEINALAENALRGHNYVLHEGLYAEVGDKRFDYNEENGKWYEITPENYKGEDNWYYQKEQEVTKGLGISYSEYWNNREEYNYAYDNPGKYAIAQAVGGYDSYMEHYDVLENWKSPNYLAADKDEKGESISGSRKKKVMDYINGLDLDYGEKIILFRTQYSSKADKKAYNMDIVNYLNSREDIDYNQMKNILEELGMTVDDEGYITW